VGWCVERLSDRVGLRRPRRIQTRHRSRRRNGAEYVFVRARQFRVSRREDSADDWSWEYVLWLGYGQKIRRAMGSEIAAIPHRPGMLDYASAKKVKLAALRLSRMPFSQSREWLVTGSKFHTKTERQLGVRSLQDWLIETCKRFIAAPALADTRLI